ncbi:2OG-Fe(II) oxygenase [Pseudoalteromonas denitrificans]|uniref:2OG-Fe(II) oxygenase superfamily protein n=1 Tax=Pseudoalteromonas denitrificans DSM 6059 TaxID=1123010 RepID=A0A1I1U6L5_9GAMM|nr:2OG-Fe(II) oxygenase [Pseudoalteromonas denitrificans]SFD66295.1 2OG-Fe(II) oxygenase superfamily protein [Pseudoalteromonas denitrificans DSM 6059]
MSDLIRTYENALSPEFCDNFIKIFEQSPHLKQGTTSGGIDLAKKDSKDLYLSMYPEYTEYNKYMLGVTAEKVFEYITDNFLIMIGAFGLTVYHPKTGEPTNLTIDNFEEVGKPQVSTLVQQLFRLGPIQAQKYQKNKGGYPYYHSEVYPQAGNNDALHRVLAFMFYLNDVDEGGETEFYYQKKKLKPTQGTMAIFPGYFTHTHKGNIPISNDKYIVTSWVLFNPAEKIYGTPQTNQK